MKKTSLILSFLVLIFVACKKDSGNASTPQVTIKIGDSAYGGIVFYLDSTGKHGLVFTITDQSTSAVWDASSNAIPSNYYPTPTGATGTAIGTGSTNTTKIIAILGSNGVAASLCRNYRGGGYDDWFLPSKDELNELYKNSFKLASLSTYKYWSSSEYVNSYATAAWSQYFLNGNQNYYGKASPLYVRAVRAF